MPSETASPSKRSDGESSGGGVFSWLTGTSSTRSPTYGTAGESSAAEAPLPLTIRTSVAGSNNSSVTSGSPSSRSSASSSPSSKSTKTKRRFIIPHGAASPGGRFGPMVTFDISTRAKTVSVKSDEVDDEIAQIQREYAASPSSRTTHVKTMKIEGAPSDNQTVEYITTTVRSPVSKQVVVKTTTTSSVDDNQAEHMPLEEKAEHVEYVTKTVESPGSEQLRTVRYVTTTTGSQAGSPVAMGQQQAQGGKVTSITTTQPQQQNVQYVTKTVGGEPQQNVQYVTKTIAGGEPQQQQQTNVQYVTKTIPGEMVTKTVVAGQPQAQNVQYVTKTVAQPQQNVATYTTGAAAAPQQNVVTYTTGAAAAPQQNVRYVTKTATPPGSVVHTLSPAHHIHYITSSQPIPAQSNQQTNHQVWMAPGQPQQVQYVARSPSAQQQQKVQYVTKTITQPGTATIQTQQTPQSQVQYITTTKTSAGSGNGAVGVGPGLATGSAAIAAGSAATMTVNSAAVPPAPAVQIKLVDGVEGLPPPHFIGVQRPASDVASSDGEASDVELVFDIMTQKFKPVRRGIVTKRKVKVAGSSASSTGSFRSGTGSGSGSTKSGSAAVIAAGAAGIALGAGAAAAAAGGASGSGAAAIAASGSAAGNAGAAAGSGAIAIQGSAAAAGSGDLEAKALGAGDKAHAATAAAAAAPRSSPMMRLDTVSTPTSAGQPPASGTPSGIKKRTPSQTKQEPSPRRFFGGSPAPSTPGSGSNPPNPATPNADVALNVEEPAPYAALRSPSHNDSTEPDAGSRLALLLKLRVCHWFTITFFALAIIVLIMVIFYKGVTLRKYQGAELATYEERYDLVDDYNGYIALFATFFAKPIELLVAVVLPMIFLSVLATALLKAKLSPRVRFAFFSLSWLLSYLLSSGFHAINVQLRVDNIEPVISLVDLSLSMSASVGLAALAAVNMSSNASLVVAESGVGNAITNTVLRNVIAPEVDVEASASATASASASGSAALLCSNTPSLDAISNLISGDVQALSTKTVATYGFPMRPWQEEMLPGALPEANFTLAFEDEIPKLVVLPMSTRTAADLLLHTVHVSRDVFHWFDAADASPLNVQETLESKYGAYAADDKPQYVSATDLLNLTSPGNAVEDALAARSFLAQARDLVNKSLAGAENVSASESTLGLSTVLLPNGLLYESVTLEIPLIRSFLSRQLKESGNKFIEDADVDPETEKTIYYDLDVANDCGPYSGLCEVRKTEFDAEGNVYEPPTTVRAFALCKNSEGDDELEVVADSTGSAPQYSCMAKSETSMLVVSVSSRIVGDELVEGPSTKVARLVDGLATIVNPRKIYSLTVGKLSWTPVNLALQFHAACAAGVGKCTGLEYSLGAALKNATENLKDLTSNLRGSGEGDEQEAEDKHLIVGSEFLPLKLLSPFEYNNTEVAKKVESDSVSGWPLVTVTKPLQVDSRFENDGDLVLPTNFETVSWKTKTLKATQCSGTVEARLASVLNNHLYIERGVQPSYTSALFFLFQDAVTKAEVALAAGGSTTLSFAQNIEFVSLHASIPLLNVVLTGVGCGVILLAALFVFIVLGKGHRRYGIVNDSDAQAENATSGFLVPSEGVARVKLDRQLFPRIVLSRRIEDGTGSGPTGQSTTTATGSGHTKAAAGETQNDDVDTFTVDTMRMQHDDRDHAVATGLSK